MRVLVLSMTTGEGHNSCAKAIKETYDLCGDYCEFADGLDFISPAIKSFVSWGHITLYRHFPKLFHIGYTLCEKKPKLFSPKSLIYKILVSGAERLFKFIQERNFDTVICTHPFAAVMITEIKKRHNPELTTAFVATDFTCAPSVKESSLDYYFIPDKCFTDDFLTENITLQKIFPIGVPVKQAFYSLDDKSESKLTLGIDKEHRHILMMCGSMGCGPLSKVAAKVAAQMKDNCELTIVCGSNKRLKKSLDKRLKNYERVRVFGFTNNMSLLLDSADIFLTKPGGISTSEAVAKGVPMVFVNTVGACETHNMEFFLEREVATFGNGTEELCNECLNLINDDDRLLKMKESLLKINKGNTSKQIREILLKQ